MREDGGACIAQIVPGLLHVNHELRVQPVRRPLCLAPAVREDERGPVALYVFQDLWDHARPDGAIMSATRFRRHADHAE